MKAVLLTQYGSPDGLQIQEVEKPAPKDHQVLVRIVAAAANPMDYHRVHGLPVISRLGGRFSRPKDPKLGGDIAGIVEAVGSAVTEFRPGDEVFGVCSGAFAEYVCAGESKLVHKPAGLSFAAAAASPVVGFTALQGLRDKGRVQPGQKVLVNGAAGGVGTFAVQIARAFGAAVTGVCSTRNLELVRSIGAEHVIDYTREDFTRTGQTYDLIYDAIGNRSVLAYRRALTPQGACVIAGFTSFPRLVEHLLVGRLASKLGSRQISFQGIASTSKQDLLTIRDLLETGKVVPVIDRCYPFQETAEAIRYLEKKHARGKVVIAVVEDLAQSR